MEQIKIFEGDRIDLLEDKVNEFLREFRPVPIVKDISFCNIGKGGKYSDDLAIIVRYENSSISPKEIEFYEGQPIFEAANSQQLFEGIEKYRKYKGEVNPPYIVRLPNNSTEVKDEAFKENSKIGAVLLPDSITRIGSFAFMGCKNLTRVNIPESVESIAGFAFAACTMLTSIYIPKSVIKLDTAFMECINLEIINVCSDNPVYDSRDYCNAIIETSTNKLIYGCKKTKIPDSIAEIGANAFLGCKDLSYINIPNSIIKIGSKAFAGCSGLTSVAIPYSVTSLGESAFGGCKNLTIDIPDSVTEIAHHALYVCKEVNIKNQELLDKSNMKR